MADQVEVSSAATYTVSTDDAGAAGQVQRVKIAYSADGVATHATVDADGVLVNLGANNDVTVAGVATAANQTTVIGHLDGVEGLLTTIDADTGNLAGILTAVQLLDNAVSGNEFQVDVLTMPTTTVTGTVTANAGTGPFPVSDNAGSLTVDAPVATPVFVRLSDGSAAIATLPVSLASVPSHAVTNAGTFATQVTSIAAGDNNIGNVDVVTLPALAAGTNNIGDVDVLTLPALPAGTNNIGDVDVLTLPAIPAGTNSIGTVQRPTGTATLTQVASSATTGTIIASNSSRKGLIVVNTDANDLYLAFAATCSATVFTVGPIRQYGEYVMDSPVFTGLISGIWASDGAGGAIVTELA